MTCGTWRSDFGWERGLVTTTKFEAVCKRKELARSASTKLHRRQTHLESLSVLPMKLMSDCSKPLPLWAAADSASGSIKSSSIVAEQKTQITSLASFLQPGLQMWIQSSSIIVHLPFEPRVTAEHPAHAAAKEH